MSNAKRPISSVELKRQQTASLANLEALRQQQVEAIEEGRAFEQNSDILVENEKLAALEKAIARAEKREELQRARNELQETKANAAAAIVAIEDAEEARLVALGEVEQAMSSMISAIAKFRALSEQSRRVCSRSLTLCSSQPVELRRRPNLEYSVRDLEMISLNDQSIRARLSGYMSCALGALTAGEYTGGKFGVISWEHSAELNQPWCEIERSAIRGMINNDFVPDLMHIVNSIAGDGDDAAE